MNRHQNHEQLKQRSDVGALAANDVLGEEDVPR